MNSANPFAAALSAALEYAVVSREISHEGYAVGFAYREAPAFERDSGWRFFSGGESDAFCDDPANFDTLPLGGILSAHPELAQIAREAEGAWEWDENAQNFTPASDWRP